MDSSLGNCAIYLSLTYQYFWLTIFDTIFDFGSSPIAIQFNDIVFHTHSQLLNPFYFNKGLGPVFTLFYSQFREGIGKSFVDILGNNTYSFVSSSSSTSNYPVIQEFNGAYHTLIGQSRGYKLKNFDIRRTATSNNSITISANINFNESLRTGTLYTRISSLNVIVYSIFLSRVGLWTFQTNNQVCQFPYFISGPHFMAFGITILQNSIWLNLYVNQSGDAFSGNQSIAAIFEEKPTDTTYIGYQGSGNFWISSFRIDWGLSWVPLINICLDSTLTIGFNQYAIDIYSSNIPTGCSVGYFISSVGNICRRCSLNCSQCSSAKVCYACNYLFTMDSTTSTCPCLEIFDPYSGNCTYSTSSENESESSVYLSIYIPYFLAFFLNLITTIILFYKHVKNNRKGSYNIIENPTSPTSP